MKPQEPKSPLYANRILWSDVEPFEVVRIISDKTIEIRPMNAELDPSWKPEWVAGGFAGHCSNQGEQRWIFSSNTEAKVIRIRKRKNGTWGFGRMVYQLSDKPRKFYDYNF